MGLQVDRGVHTVGDVARRRSQRRRAHGAWQQLAGAVGAHAAEQVVAAAGAEGALEGADAGVERVGRKIGVAVLAAGAQVQHRITVASGGSVHNDKVLTMCAIEVLAPLGHHRDAPPSRCRSIVT